MFDDGEDMSAYFDWSSVRRPGHEPKRFAVALPAWMVARIDSRAKLQGTTRSAILEALLADRLKATG